MSNESVPSTRPSSKVSEHDAQHGAPERKGLSRWVRSRSGKVVASLLALIGVLVLGMKLWSARTYDSSNPRSLPNSYLMKHTVLVDRAPAEVFEYITYRLQHHYQATAKAHERFEVINAKGLTEGAIFVSEEFDGDEGVFNRYVVREAVPNRLLHFASTPTTIYERKQGELKQVGTCNAFVYFDLEDAGNGQTRLSQTLVIQMPNFLTKFIIDMVNEEDEGDGWSAHLAEELEGLKTLIEADGNAS